MYKKVYDSAQCLFRRPEKVVCKALALPSTRKSALKMIDRNARLIAGVINGLLICILNAAEG